MLFGRNPIILSARWLWYPFWFWTMSFLVSSLILVGGLTHQSSPANWIPSYWTLRICCPNLCFSSQRNKYYSLYREELLFFGLFLHGMWISTSEINLWSFNIAAPVLYLILCYGFAFHVVVTSLSSYLCWCHYMQEFDLTKPGVPKPMKRDEFEVTTEEVLRKADFRVSMQLYLA